MAGAGKIRACGGNSQNYGGGGGGRVAVYAADSRGSTRAIYGPRRGLRTAAPAPTAAPERSTSFRSTGERMSGLILRWITSRARGESSIPVTLAFNKALNVQAFVPSDLSIDGPMGRFGPLGVEPL